MTACISTVLRVATIALACAGLSIPADARQTLPDPASAQRPVASTQEILEQLTQLRAELDAVRQQLAEQRRESDAMRRELTALRDGTSQDHELLNAKVREHEQTKVESGSKYNVRLSGMVLLNLAGTRGSVDNIDLPLAAESHEAGAAGGSVTASVRQSFVNLEVFGPEVGGAKTSGDISLDLFGGFPPTPDGLSAPHPRLRTANLKMDWTNLSVAAGQDTPFFSPLTPTSLLGTAYPAFSSSGNLWTWTPQVFVEGRRTLSSGALIAISGGVLDPFTGELPASEYERLPTAGEHSGVPALAMHVGVRTTGERQASVGAGAYYAKQDWGFDRGVDGWAATADWDLPLGHGVSLAGEAYRGRAIGGLGGGLSASALFDGPQVSASSKVTPVDSAGGWVQLKIAPTNRLQFNAAWGGDRPRCSAAACAAAQAFEPAAMRRNATASLNAIYQVRSNLLFSVEYRRLWTNIFGGQRSLADHFSLNTGIAF